MHTSYKAKNQVLNDGARSSLNFYSSDRILRHYLRKELSSEGWAYMLPLLERLGHEAAGRMNRLSLLADKNGPELVKRSPLGEDIDEIRFHPAYWELMDIAVESEMLRIKWEPGLRRRFAGENHRMGFSAFFLYAMSELGLDCPLCMTDGAALLLDRYASDEDRDRLLPHIYTKEVQGFYTGGMFMTEKSGGSDVGRNLVSASLISGSRYRLEGEKWFCSNANGQVIFTLARTDPDKPGTRGLSLFLLEPELPSGAKNAIQVVRLKEKLGVRSMASAECVFHKAEATRVGEEFQGFKIMANMVNLSRIHNALAAVAAGRRALAEAFQFLSFRETFGKCALEHALIRSKLTELGALHVSQFYFLWRAIKAFDNAMAGDAKEAQLLRVITPMLKKWTAETAVYIVRESMELMGGMGYIEDTILPKLMRDTLVLPIWEGAGNIQVLDLLRAMHKSEGMALLFEEIAHAPEDTDISPILQKELAEIRSFLPALANCAQDDQELAARNLMDRLLPLWQMALLLTAKDEESKAWIQPALAFWKRKFSPSRPIAEAPLTLEEVKAMIAWEF